MTVYDNIPSAVLYGGVRYRTNGNAMTKDVGLSSYAWGVPVPGENPNAAEASGGNLEAGTYKIHTVFRSRWGRIGNPRSDGPVSVAVSTDNYKINLTGIPVSGDPQVSHVFFYVTTPDASSPFYYAGSVENGTTTYSISANHANWDTSDYLEPAYLSQDFESLLAGPFRYGIPALKRQCEVFDDRIFCAGELEYSGGLASATNGSDVMTGDAGMSLHSGHVGKWITLHNENTAYRIESLYTERRFKVDRNYVRPSWRSADPSGVAYVITGHVHEVIFSEQGEPEYFPSANSFSVGSDEGGRITALKAVGPDLIVATERSLFRIYTTGNAYQPYGVRRTYSPVGCTAPRSMVIANGSLFFWGGDGFYAFGNNTAVNISEPALGEIHRDMTQTLLTHIQGCYHDEKIYWAVPYDDGEYLDRLLVYDLKTKEWDLPWKSFQIIDMQTAVSTDTGRRNLLFSQKAGDNYALHYFDNDLWNDGAYNADYSGTADAATANTLTDNSAFFVTGGGGLAGSAVYIRSGTGSGQERRIGSNTATVITVSEAWDTIPDATSEYVIGVPRYRGRARRETLGHPHDEKIFRYAEFGLLVSERE